MIGCAVHFLVTAGQSSSRYFAIKVGQERAALSMHIPTNLQILQFGDNRARFAAYDRLSTPDEEHVLPRHHEEPAVLRSVSSWNTSGRTHDKENTREP